MDPEIWGPHAWVLLHTITLVYPHKPTNNDKQTYKNFFINLYNILPCDWCSHNYKIHLDKYPIDNYLNSKKNIVQWLINIHNETNKLLNKNIYFTYDNFITKYKEIYKQNNTCKYNVLVLLIILLIVFILIKYYKIIEKKIYNLII
tara:strand:+ start:677 stop:1114 length:438 start_codon:yes stop_codon:yes gene_type:complete